jgi:serine/threonine protein kinase
MATPPGSVSGLQPGQTVGGERYLLKKILGQGGMGVVWLAFDKRLREPVALKFLPAQIVLDPEALEELRRETSRSRKLSHPHIIRIHDFYEGKHELSFISMEYVDGPDLHVLRARRGTKVLPWKFLAPLVRQLCQALAYAHGERVLHRDLKPANLMVDSNGRLKLADFGLACVLHDSMTRISGLGRTGGTLNYMSPQQADGQAPAISDDIYGLGATLYELLSSRPPFYSGDIGYQVRNNRPPHLRERLLELELTNEDIPSEVAALVMACLAKKPEQRPASVGAILDWLDAAEKPETKPATGATSQASATDAVPAPAPPPAVAAEAAASSSALLSREPPPATETVSEPTAPAPDEIAPPPVEVEEALLAAAPGVAAPEPQTGVSAPSPTVPSPRRLKPALKAAFWSVFLLGLAGAGWYWADHQARKKEGAPGMHAQVKPDTPATEARVNTLTDTEKAAGWQLLFNGTDLNGWQNFKRAGVRPGWQVKDGVLACTDPRNAGDIVTANQYEWFELQLDYNIARKGNSGILYHVTEDGGTSWASGPEFQLEDNQEATDPIRCGWLYALYQPPNDPRTGRPLDATKPVGEWNHVRLLVSPEKCEHEINGVKYFDYVLDSDDFKARVAASKFGKMPFFAKSRAGYIALQGDLGQVSFRNIKVRPLPSPRSTLPGVIVGRTNPVPPLRPTEGKTSFGDVAGYESLFNGANLTGWTALDSPGIWSVEDGAIVGRTPGRVDGDTFLVWMGGEVRDFELRFRFLGDPSGGFMYRADVRSEKQHKGYLARVGKGIGGHLDEQMRGSGTRRLTARGAAVVVATDGTRRTNSVVASPAALKSAFKPGAWNDYVVLAQSNRFIHRLNGVTVSDVTDLQSSRYHSTGKLALEFPANRNQGATLQFKDIYLKRQGP